MKKIRIYVNNYVCVKLLKVLDTASEKEIDEAVRDEIMKYMDWRWEVVDEALH